MKALGWILALPLSVLLSTLIMTSCGFAAAMIWEWYGVPRGLPVVSWKEWAAVMMVAGLMKAKNPAAAQPADARSPAEKGFSWFSFFFVPWLAVATAWWLR